MDDEGPSPSMAAASKSSNDKNKENKDKKDVEGLSGQDQQHIAVSIHLYPLLPLLSALTFGRQDNTKTYSKTC